MKAEFKIGAEKIFEKKVSPEDIAQFESGTVHEIYSTFAIARDAEWCTRLFVLDMKEEGEEGIGTLVEIEHVSPALIGSNVIFKAQILELNNHEIICSFDARVGQRIIAKGRTGQKILRKRKA